MLQGAVIRQQDQPLAIVVQPPGGVYIWHVDIVSQGGPALTVGELAEDEIGFV
jgi:hypothetical protein